jgi:hypothetical protein
MRYHFVAKWTEQLEQQLLEKMDAAARSITETKEQLLQRIRAAAAEQLK